MRTFPSLVPVGALTCILALLAPVAAADPAAPPVPPATTQAHRWAQAAEPPTEPGTVEGTDGLPQTSDRVPGAIAGALPPSYRGATKTLVRKRWQVAPGVRATVWDERSRRGPIRAYLLAIDWKAPGITLDYANDGAVRRTAPVKKMLARDRAVAGVNGDFFDIGDTGAPLGIGRDRQRGLLNGRATGWNSAFYLTRSGRPEIGPIAATARIKERPGLHVNHVNSPEVFPGNVGLYTSKWGLTSGYRITGGQKSKVRMVRVRNGVVVRNTVRLPSNTRIDGEMLVGRGDGAKALVGLKRGTKVTVRTRVQDTPRMAITGNQFLVDDGLIKVIDDREMHPRTAIGIDRDTHEILLLVVDGRQSFSRGYTMVELAQKMIDLGADEALNLDGGGSSTMVAKRARVTDVINSPSDGFQRSVANAVEVLYRKPRD